MLDGVRHELAFSVHLEERCNQRDVVARTERDIDSPGLELTKRVADRDGSRRAASGEGVRRSGDPEYRRRQAHGLARHAAVQLAKRIAGRRILLLAPNLVVPEGEAAARRTIEEAHSIRGERALPEPRVSRRERDRRE